MASSGVFRQTAGVGATQYHGTVPRDKGIGQPDHRSQIERYYGRSEHQPYLNPYHGRPVVDQTLGDQFGEPRYELDVGLQIKNLIMADAEQPWFTILLPLQETDALTITGTVWKYNRRLPRPTPYHAPSPYVTEEFTKYYGQLQRYGESIRMESDFYHTNEGMQNFILKLTGIASDMVEGIRFDVLREMLRAIDEHKRYYALQTFTENPMKDIAARVALFGALNKAPTKHNQLGVMIERLERALHDIVPGPYEVVVPPEWGIFFHLINQTPAPQPFYFMGDIFVQNGPTPKGIIGRNRYWEYPDVTVETGALPLRMLQRKVSVAEYYRSQFKGRYMNLCNKFTGLFSGDRDVGKMRNLFVYSLDEDRYIELNIESMIDAGAVVPDHYSTPAIVAQDRFGHGAKVQKLLAEYRAKKAEIIDRFHPKGDTLAESLAGSTHRGMSGGIRQAPIWLFYEPKANVDWPDSTDPRYVRIVRYSGETDENVQGYRDHLNQGQVLCAKLISTYKLDLIGTHYSNAVRLRSTLRDAPANDVFFTRFIEVNLHLNVDVAFGPDVGSPADATFEGSQLTRVEDSAYFDRWGTIAMPTHPEFATEMGGHYNLPAKGASGGLQVPPGCDCGIGLLSLARVDESGDLGWPIAKDVREHFDAIMSMIDVARTLPGSELVNPLNRAPWVHSTNPDVGALDVAYSNGISQFHPPAFLKISRGYTFTVSDPHPDAAAAATVVVTLTFAAAGDTGAGEAAATRGVADVGSAIGPSSLGDETPFEEDEEEMLAADVRISGPATVLKPTAAETDVYIRTALAFTPGMAASKAAGQLTLAVSADPDTVHTQPQLPAEGPAGGAAGKIGAPWQNGSPREFHHSAFNMVHGAMGGMDRAGYFSKRRRAGARSSSTSTRTTSSSSSAWDAVPSRRSTGGGLLGATRRTRTQGRRTSEEGEGFKVLKAGARETAKWTEAEETFGLGTGASRVLSAIDPTAPGYDMVLRFNGSNFVRKMREVTESPGDPVTFFTIAAMMSRQDKKEHWKKLVKHGLHLAVDFLNFRVVDVLTESAILAKAGLGITVINNADYKNGETVSTKTYHGHLTVHYGAVVTKRDWQMMLEDMRLTGYVGGKGKGFMKHPAEFKRSSASTGPRAKSVICFAMPIASQELPSYLSLSGQWEMPDVIPQNLPESGYLFHGVDWYEKMWSFHERMTEERPKQRYFKSKGYIMPQVALVGWHAEYNITAGEFTVSSYGQGHLAKSDYPGAKAVVEGNDTWLDPPPKNELALY